jgi:hypothetical protein
MLLEGIFLGPLHLFIKKGRVRGRIRIWSRIRISTCDSRIRIRQAQTMRILRFRIPEYCFPFDKIKLRNRKYNYRMNNPGLTLVSVAAKLLFSKLLAKNILIWSGSALSCTRTTVCSLTVFSYPTCASGNLLYTFFLSTAIQCHSLGSVIGGRSNLHRKPFFKLSVGT